MNPRTDDKGLVRHGTLAADLFRHRKSWLHARLDHLKQVPDTEAYRRLHDFVTLHEKLLPDGHLHDGGLRCRPVPARRHFGEFRWFDAKDGVIVGAHWPSFQPRASSVSLAFPVESGGNVLKRLEELGFPAPETDPTMVIGDPDRPEGSTWIYVPGPGQLAELVYRLRKTADGWDVIITAERPPEGRYEELITELDRAFGWDGTLVFPTGDAFREKEADHKPPGSARIQQVA